MYDVRLMTPEDIPQVAVLERATFSEPWTESGFKSALDRRDTIFYVACVEDKIIGYAGFYYCLDEANITNVAVNKEYRGQGIGEMLVSSILLECTRRNLATIGLEVRAGNEAAIGLYTKLGFEKVGVRKNFYRLPHEDAFVMTKYIETEDK